MLIKNVSQQALEKALEDVNRHYDGNVRLSRCDLAYTTNAVRTDYRVRLAVKDSRGRGGALSWVHPALDRKARRTGAACWHVWRAFLTALPSGIECVARAGVWRHGMPLIDETIGTGEYAVPMSELCDCTD